MEYKDKKNNMTENDDLPINQNDNNIIDLRDITSYGLTINNQPFNTNINLYELIKANKYLIMNEKNLNSIPNLPGNYWILTTEPIKHSLNPDFNHRPNKLLHNGTEYYIIYNGQGDTIRTRINAHLYRPKTKGLGDMSGISIDITNKYKQGENISHNKNVYSPGKPYRGLMDLKKKDLDVLCKKRNIKDKKNKKQLVEILDGLCDESVEEEALSIISSNYNSTVKLPYIESEKRQMKFEDTIMFYGEDDLEEVIDYCKDINKESTVYFKNGIDISEKKHSKYSWLVIYYDMNKEIYHPFSDVIEQEWRRNNGSPILCSYKCGR